MSLKWTGSESGILRKSESKEKKEDLFVFGYSCKLFRDDERALHIDQGKHLIPWMGDETLKIDRYDARGALHDLSTLEAPPGGYDWRVELTRTELDVEQLCDEERYRALHTDEDEEEMYKEEELKRYHAAGYGQVGFNYDAPVEQKQEAEVAEVEEPFEPTPEYRALFQPNVVMPETQKQNAIIEKTAKFIASQGAQMEILIKAKQGDNQQFVFLNKDSHLNPYYMALIGLVRAGKWPEKKQEVVEEKHPETNNDEYLHPSLATTVIESAPSIPSIHYKPSADCDYTMLISKMRCASSPEECAPLAAGEVAPPGTEPVPPLRAQIAAPPVMYRLRPDVPPPPPPIPPRVTRFGQPPPVQPPPRPTIPPAESTGLSLMKNYNTDSDTEDSDSDDTSSSDSREKELITQPPEDVRLVIDKMAAYVARNGDDFADIVRAKNDPRFTFLEPDNVYHAYYKRTMQEKRGVNGVKSKSKKNSAVVSFSIKKPKAPDPILPKPALPYESSTDDESEKQEKADEQLKPPEIPKANAIQCPVPVIPQVVVYKMASATENDLPTVKTIEQPRIVNNIPPKGTPSVVTEPIIITPAPVVEEIPPIVEEPKPQEEEKKEIPNVPEEKREVVRSRTKERESPSHRDRRKHKDRKKRYKRSKSEGRDSRRSDREKKRDRHREKEREERDRKKRRGSNELETEIISLEDNSDDLIDLTGDQSDSKGECSPEGSRREARQRARRARAAEFLRRAGVAPAAAAAALPATSLASAMVDTLELLRKKKAEEEEKKRRREKRRHRDRRDYDDHDKHRRSKRSKKNRSSDDEDSDLDGQKKKKRKKDKKQSSRSKRRRREDSEEEENPTPLKIDLLNTLKELRTTSPTKELGLQIEEDSQNSYIQRETSESSETEDKQNKKKEREYSEGEWSSDSEDSSSASYE